MKVFLNGRIVPAEQALVPCDDAGLQHAVGLFETMSAYRGRVFLLQEHLERLAQSAVMLGLVRRLEIGPLAEAVNMTLAANQFSQARIRLTLTAGSLSLLQPPPPSPQEHLPTILIVATPPTRYDPAFFERGVRVLLARAYANPLDPLAGHKTLSYWSRLRTLRQAASVGAHEAIWMSVTQHLTGGAISNLFLVKNGQLLTPFARGEEISAPPSDSPGFPDTQSLPAPVLPGTVRALVMELARQMGMNVRRAMLTPDDLVAADEAFLTNSSWLVLPVTQVNQGDLRDGTVGPITRELMQKVRNMAGADAASDLSLGKSRPQSAD